MDKGKVKTAVIAILLILDLILGTFLIWQTATARKAERNAFQNLKTVMHANGVELLPEELPSADGIYTLLSERSLSAEAALARVFTGSDQGQDQGGNIYYYTGSTGEAWFRGSGDFEVLFSEPAAQMDSAVRKALLQYGMDPDRKDAVQQVDGLNVFNCTLSAHYTNALLTSVTGRLVAGSFSAVVDTPAMDAGTALLRFIASLEDNGFICTEVSSMELGYLMSALVTGGFQLTPVWRVVTDTGEYYVNAITGAVERLSA